ncbi:MAG: hypothetical protein UX85_C0003G0033 [Candidatus Beckwithbacteria bacterium GW2011_GWB1_47_15]|uniref:Fimbrial assembly family protein n=1 Tax=Candidatus Beckwithbacteria bacterium GW2011_GWB1_47_15 TaxID=1618371 RepID=A0A0G1RVM2_9BACT|nr:MAG: hypothetical protein UY43_C0001G0431 [Candidatus Beckwithbacteria bacterium GW2011_GWC1_49_16]KKU35279.1 MAG: hypothetical protein UX50_C0004G0010 [Candidatus Beckwithbacteria bacterium GW2011_GWA1_46_30]KKU61374.1 MAG: hypothetical protein UX85_C0003G0033 [Candidatus Beckwithbacteria bacterium GW2011_GWB1_47_15]KKU71781.1 MAG: hypothetical protein UX97_C0003G0010 [Candidatus Beckwithbacteria bacterium GW2011_GWA2_47_25]OGD48727.1 MAG: hypothetical protein A2877_03580 [Candidatus Beckwi
MSAEINLFPRFIARVRRSQRWKYFTWESLIFLVAVLGGTMIGLSSYSIYLNRLNTKLDQQVKKVTSQIEDLREIETKQVYLLGKLESFEGLLLTHERHQAITETVFAILPDGTSLKGFEVDEGGVINLNGSVPDFFVLNQLFDRVRQGRDYRLPIVSATIAQVSFGEDGEVNFKLALNLGGGGK